MHSKNSIVHVFDQNDKQGIIPFGDYLVKATRKFGKSRDVIFSDKESLINQLRDLPSLTLVHYHTVKAALHHRNLGMSNVPFYVDLVDYVEPKKSQEYTASQRKALLDQRWVFENAQVIFIDDKIHQNQIEDWFIEQPLFGGGEFYYNFDNAQKISSKCIQIPLLLNESLFDFQKINRNKLLWMSAVHGIDPDQVYFSISGEGLNWTEVVAYFKEFRALNEKLRFLVFNLPNTEELRSQLDRENIPSSFFIPLNPRKNDLAACLNLARVHLKFDRVNSKSNQALEVAQQMMGKFVISTESEANKFVLSPDQKKEIKALMEQELPISQRLEIRNEAVKAHGLFKYMSKIEQAYSLVFK